MPRIEKKLSLGKLFDDVTSLTYNRVYKKLQELRLRNPANRDDELLMLMLCRMLCRSPEADREFTNF
jgi:hypothetical protein